jgi:biotin transport system substrate-specific component
MSAVVTGAVIADRWVKNSLTKSAVLIAGLVGLTAISAQIAVPLPFTPVPLTLQTFAVLAGAAALGAERAVIAQVSYIVLALAGLPILAGGASGATKVMGATGGYLLGFVVASYLVGKIAERGATVKVRSTVLAYAIGTLVIYSLGALWLAQFTGQGLVWAIVNGVVPFLIGDAIKAIAAGAVLPTAWKLTSK